MPNISSVNENMLNIKNNILYYNYIINNFFYKKFGLKPNNIKYIKIFILWN